MTLYCLAWTIDEINEFDGVICESLVGVLAE